MIPGFQGQPLLPPLPTPRAQQSAENRGKEGEKRGNTEKTPRKHWKNRENGKKPPRVRSEGSLGDTPTFPRLEAGGQSPPSVPASSAVPETPGQPRSPSRGPPAPPSARPRLPQVGDAAAQGPPREAAPSPPGAELGGPGVPELATDGWRQLADTCPSSPALPFLRRSFCLISPHGGRGPGFPPRAAPSARTGSGTPGQGGVEGCAGSGGAPRGPGDGGRRLRCLCQLHAGVLGGVGPTHGAFCCSA